MTLLLLDSESLPVSRICDEAREREDRAWAVLAAILRVGVEPPCTSPSSTTLSLVSTSFTAPLGALTDNNKVLLTHR